MSTLQDARATLRSCGLVAATTGHNKYFWLELPDGTGIGKIARDRKGWLLDVTHAYDSAPPLTAEQLTAIGAFLRWLNDHQS
jgi:hypothetical protein